MIKKESWYRNSKWSGQINDAFESGLKKEREKAKKAAALFTQGNLLLQQQKSSINTVGIVLLERVLEDYSSEYEYCIAATNSLCIFYIKQKNFTTALVYNNKLRENTQNKLGNSEASDAALLTYATILFGLNVIEHKDEIMAIISSIPRRLPNDNAYNNSYTVLLKSTKELYAV